MNNFPRIPALSAVPLAIAALALSACGSNGDTSTTAGSASSPSSDTVATADVSGQTVLVDSNGAALYSPDQEADGKILCVKSCEAIWKPLTVSAGTQPTASSDVSGTVSTVKRPDGSQQVTVDGAPLYTFTQEGPGQVTGDGAKDSFGGTDFSWHVVMASGSAGGTSTVPPSTTTSSSSSSGGYSY